MKYLILILILFTSISAHSGESVQVNLPLEIINAIIDFKEKPYTSEINPFTTDKCTKAPQSYIPFSNREGWTHCCTEHDIAHWAGGNEQTRKNADLRLKQCMKNVNGPGELFYRAVQIFGHPAAIMSRPEGRSSPWSYGWNYYMEHDELTPEQEESVCDKFGQWQKTEQFQEFHEIYVGMQGQVPVMPNCD